MSKTTTPTTQIENELREAYFTLWAAVENGIDNDTFFKLRETFRGIQTMIEEDDENTDIYSPDCFDGRFFKWDDFVLDTLCEEGDNIYVLSHKGERIKLFYFSLHGYENDQEVFLNDMLEGAKKWIARNNIR